MGSDSVTDPRVTARSCAKSAQPHRPKRTRQDLSKEDIWIHGETDQGHRYRRQPPLLAGQYVEGPPLARARFQWSAGCDSLRPQGRGPAIGQGPSELGPFDESSVPYGSIHVFYQRMPIDRQAEQLRLLDPAYLLMYPSNAVRLANYFRAHDLRLPNLREVMTYGETVLPETREVCQEAWGVAVSDMYSCEEVGYIALQCPQADHYHCQSESVLVEVLDAEGRPCSPGQIGKVVLTSLHNFAMPLIRYQNQDYAEVGPSCPCGRGLPVIKRVLGRERNIHPSSLVLHPLATSNSHTTTSCHRCANGSRASNEKRDVAAPSCDSPNVRCCGNPDRRGDTCHRGGNG